MPAWNESAVIGSTIRDVQQNGPRCVVLVVDDGSEDATPDIAREAGAVVLQLPFNMGVGAAMRAGFTFAERMGFTRAVQLDADGQHNPKDVQKLLDAVDAGADIVIGARFADVGEYEVHGPRKWAMNVLAGVLSRLAKTRLTDVTSGFRAASEKAIHQYVRHYPAEYLGDTIDSLVGAIRAGCIVQQVPVAMRPRQGGVPSHSPWKAAIYLGRSGLALGFALIRRTPGAKPKREGVRQ
ncbi:glycosyltransferase family 2 protein [Pseudoclavibacter sp. 13-3]|uniref:glycosyltransferase family 2 protein n=1 Tax=Pseudoclavibacter sp. 13-3 TaxID=2901228 RepID=UPI001E3E6F6C|nr:glycosyltransferase family 2 protein [Pseudoclavibacter sp. 13-3]MCD7101229.1 glycosyltransferase family 2 protein [Pseudoclavibacter sp. 13-3]